MKLIFALAITTCVQLVLVAAAPRAPSVQRYDGHEVVRAFPSSVEHVRLLQALQEDNDFWSRPRLNGPTDIRLTPSNKAAMRDFLEQNEIRYEVFIADVEEKIQEEARSQVASPDAIDWTSYHRLAEIQAWLNDIASQNADVAEVFNIGKSTEGRDLLVIRIGYPSADGKAKKSYFLDAGIHAREWIAPAIATWHINELISNRAQHEDLLRAVDFYYFPNANPDGFEYSHTNDRLWRKTRSNHNSPLLCKGVDPNRNFDVAWGGEGTSSNKCSEIYHGPNAFSEPETQAMTNFINATNADWRVYNALHSYAQMILTPWGYTYDLPDDYQDLKNLGDDAAAALRAVHNKVYEVGSVTELLSPGAGGSDDWAKGSGNFKYSYTMEVRDTGAYGFLLPANQIIATAEETFAAVMVQANFIKNSN